jgi:UDP-N-acetylglucosamine 2-epimerase (non-hydrolysing)
MRKVLTILGTRPEAIKLAPVLLELRRRPNHFCSILCTTAQHREMLDQALSIFGLTADYDLSIMLPGQSLSMVTARAIERLEPILSAQKPDIILVQGDTTTSLCGALAGYYQKIRVGHIEAGLRTGDKFAPFPEEMNRILITRLADYHFAPTEHAKQTLLSEGVPSSTIFVTGNTVIDALLLIRTRIRINIPELPKGLTDAIQNKRLILVTGHRRESFGEGFENICNAINEVANRYPDVLFIYPVHLNPNVRKSVYPILAHNPRIMLIEPLSYEAFVWLMDQATIILTDSGGIQEEAPSLGKPVLVMREATERIEGIESGSSIMVGTSISNITNELTKLLDDAKKQEAMKTAHNPYGDGQAAKRIVDILTQI